MSKYEPLWEHIQKTGAAELTLTFRQVEEIAGVALDHSFLRYKKELLAFGYQVGKISMKGQTVEFRRVGDT